MKTTLIPLMLALGALATAGCADGSLAKRNDGRYVAAPVNSATGATVTSNDVHHVVAPGETGRQLAPNKATDANTVVAVESPSQQKKRDDQDKLEDDLTKLGKE